MALVGANFPDIKTPAESGEIINTPVKDLLEQFKSSVEANKKEGIAADFSDKEKSNTKYSTSTTKQVIWSWHPFLAVMLLL